MNLQNMRSEEHNRRLLRTRLIAMIEILFGGQIIVTEGWGVDSLMFFLVASEICAAYEKVVEDHIRVVDPKKFNPLLMETRREKDYLKIFDSYLSRDEVRWHGFSPHLMDPDRPDREPQLRERRASLRARIAEAEGRRPDAFYAELESHTGKFLGSAVAKVSEYFGSNPYRYVQGKAVEGLFDDAFKRELDAFEKSFRAKRLIDPVGEDVIRARAILTEQKQSFSRSRKN